MKSQTVKRRFTIAIASLGMFAALPASAAYFCDGTVTGVDVTKEGVVVASTSFGLSWVTLCSIETRINDTAPAACKAILGILLTAKTSNQQTQWAFNDSLTCTSHPAWNTLTGWYWGPALLP